MVLFLQVLQLVSPPVFLVLFDDVLNGAVIIAELSINLVPIHIEYLVRVDDPESICMADS